MAPARRGPGVRAVAFLHLTEPGVYYPTGRRNFARVLPADDTQAAGDAVLARSLGIRRVYVLDEGADFSRLFVDDFVRAARRLGIAVAGRATWERRRRTYAGLAREIGRAGVDGVFLGVSSYPASIRLLTTLRSRLGRKVLFVGPDVFDPATALLAGSAAEGVAISQPGPPISRLPREGKQFAASYASTFGAEPTRYAMAAAQAMDLLLDAIAHSDGSRTSVTSNLFKTRVSNGILGSFWITPAGETTLNVVAIYRIIGGKVTTFKTVVVPDALIGSD